MQSMNCTSPRYFDCLGIGWTVSPIPSATWNSGAAVCSELVLPVSESPLYSSMGVRCMCVRIERTLS